MSRAADHAYSEIRSLILSGDAPPGSQLKEEQLAELCGVSRTPVRDALRRLETELYVVRSDSQRAFVADWSRAEVEEMFTLRAMLEAHAAARAAKRVTTDTLAALQACNRDLTAAIEQPQPDVPRFLAANREFHRLILEAAGSALLAVTLGSLVEAPVIRRTALHYSRKQLDRSAREHDELLQAFAARDPDWAHAVMSAHIRRAFHAFGSVPVQEGNEAI